MPVQSIPRLEQTIAAGTLAAVDNSGVGGSANLRGLGQQTEVSMNVTGLTEVDRQVQAAVLQAPASSLAPRRRASGPSPWGQAPSPAGTVLDAQHALIIKGQNAGPATPPLACAPLPDWQRLPPSA